ncbi:replication factor-a protein [Metschnikowia bicuspidata]|uniref:Replication protein A subunit n=1 Tax=Metschnikowia bicuspidata TaxID=27322 RepID=A0A4P9ZFW2_9ASCO|nr:replication factor-a protein [Metschnikowia bicuspidata]
MTETYGIVPGTLKEALSKSTCHLWRGKGLRVQVTNSKVINESSAAERRYRCVLSDGKYSIQGLIEHQCNAYIEANGFARFSIVTINQYSFAKTVKRILVVSSLTVDVPKAERISSDLINLDPFFNENPSEDIAAQVPSANAQQQNATPQPQAPKPAAPSRPRNDCPVNPIESLSPYQNNWTIKGRVSYKGDIRTWSNSKGEGKLFNVNFLDESEEIRATAFNEMADKFANILEEGKVYYVTKARIQQSKPKFSHLSHPYELSLDRDTEITECFDTADVPKINFNFSKLDAIQNLEKDTILDVIGVINNVKEIYQITAKSTGKPFNRRNITIVDDTNFAIDVGLWNATAVDFSIPVGSVVALKGVKVQDFGGRSLSLTHAGSIVSNPDIPEAYQLKGWYDNKGAKENFKVLKTESSGSFDALSRRKTIAQAESEGLGGGEKPDYFSLKTSISYIKSDNLAYPACSNEVNTTGRGPSPCNRKVIQEGDGSWRCERCNLTYPEPHYRYILNASIVDHTGQIWVTLFDDDATKLFGMSAGELLQLKEMPDDSAFTKIINSGLMKEFSFRLSAKQDSYNGTVRTRYQVSSINSLDYAVECHALAKELQKVLRV